MPVDQPAFLKPTDVATRYGIKVEKVLAWINQGQLIAVNVAQQNSGRPRWKIDPAQLTAFEAARSSRKPTPTPQPRRRRTTPGVKQYF